ncbi:hypothetical protein E3N88_13129 [Mikania micrantha]|uniref:Uncharacterized protein n=1 Tax=Mikania micrantha TaxID=192012 RepID=A0A5N6P7L1_9ASTR|nr:hypothetical protein E3N88_13129 [Mikania micrantha]
MSISSPSPPIEEFLSTSMVDLVQNVLKFKIIRLVLEEPFIENDLLLAISSRRKFAISTGDVQFNRRSAGPITSAILFHSTIALRHVCQLDLMKFHKDSSVSQLSNSAVSEGGAKGIICHHRFGECYLSMMLFDPARKEVENLSIKNVSSVSQVHCFKLHEYSSVSQLSSIAITTEEGAKVNMCHQMVRPGSTQWHPRLYYGVLGGVYRDSLASQTPLLHEDAHVSQVYGSPATQALARCHHKVSSFVGANSKSIHYNRIIELVNNAKAASFDYRILGRYDNKINLDKEAPVRQAYGSPATKALAVCHQKVKMKVSFIISQFLNVTKWALLACIKMLLLDKCMAVRPPSSDHVPSLSGERESPLWYWAVGSIKEAASDAPVRQACGSPATKAAVVCHYRVHYILMDNYLKYQGIVSHVSFSHLHNLPLDKRMAVVLPRHWPCAIIRCLDKEAPVRQAYAVLPPRHWACAIIRW